MDRHWSVCILTIGVWGMCIPQCQYCLNIDTIHRSKTWWVIKHDIIVMVAPHSCCLYMEQGGREEKRDEEREGGGEREGEGGRERARVKSWEEGDSCRHQKNAIVTISLIPPGPLPPSPFSKNGCSFDVICKPCPHANSLPAFQYCLQKRPTLKN